MGVLLAGFIKERPEVVLFDPEAAMQTRLFNARKNVLERAGGTLTTAEAAEVLRTTAGAVRKRIQRGTLLSYRTTSGEHRLPKAQFDGADTIKGLEKVLDGMHVEDPWMRIQLFFDDDVIGALRDGRVEIAVRAVRTYLPRDEG